MGYKVLWTDHNYVAPFTGAWIETTRARRAGPDGSVAPFTGAWIEA